VTLALLLAGALQAGAAPEYRAEIERWRVEREAGLKAEDGWLALVGLHWLEAGANSFGSARDNAIVLPASAPARAGRLEHRAGRTRVFLADGVDARVEDGPAHGRELGLGQGARGPDVLRLGSLSMFVIRRGDRFALRVRDSESPTRRSFKGLEWFPVDAAYRVAARFVPHASETRIPIPNVLGGVTRMRSPGTVVFELGGKSWTLDPVFESDGARELFFIFKDETARKETYGSGRFLYSELPRDGGVVLDFNKAYSPPCAYTEYATCPLPPKQNVLGLRIEAGERFSGN
jgi:uncharacterized protein (DUF1684 family)